MISAVSGGRSERLENGYLCPNFQNIFKAHASCRELALEEHNDIMVMFVNLLPFWRLGRAALSIPLFNVCLEGSYLLIDIRNVLFDYECQFLVEF
jgi:hypothetical protein